MTDQTLATVSQLIDALGRQEASDLHLTSNRGAFYVKDKQTRPIPSNQFSSDDRTLRGLMGGLLDDAETLMKTKGQASASFDTGGEYRGRVAFRREEGGLSCTIRIISRDIPSISTLELPQTVTSLITRPSGLVLYVGQTGSGKSTTIAAQVNEVAQTQSTGIYTLESPIEYLYPLGKSLVIQREVGTHVNTFAEGIEDAKRSHPRIIVVGEILNVATARSALLAAASGHLVISTMHAGTAAEAVDSFTSMFTPEEQGLVRTQLAQSLLAIVAQKLIPKVRGGLALAMEIALNTPSMAELLRGSGDRTNDTKFIQQLLLGAGTKDGMVAMEQSLARLVKSGSVSLEVARYNARDHKALEEKLTQFDVQAASRAA
ncbi:MULTISPECIES: ATPase, T2SS/T4P/T4SS family [unclassified Microbacterium]|uniref:type IV pilus twitching motility protein PilT n=1 Tax=unclassified Microbacterium TaxID=2609290 RepID=UPI0028832223|nr:MULTISPECIES: ATPase, T2SS/T4P/T4SS family [unclassified Microbacterium]